MPFGWVAAAGAAAGVLGASASSSASRQQADAIRRGQDIQQAEFNQTRSDMAPWRQAGQNALGQISDMSGFFNKQFGPDDLATNLAPNYEFIKQQGLGALQNFATSKGGLLGGNTLKDISQWTTGYAQNSYQQAFQNFTANQSNIFNRLASVAQLGQTANQSTAQVGTSLAQSMAEGSAALGAARASGTVGVANALGGGLQNAASFYALPSILNWGGGIEGGGGGGGGGGDLGDIWGFGASPEM